MQDRYDPDKYKPHHNDAITDYGMDAYLYQNKADEYARNKPGSSPELQELYLSPISNVFRAAQKAFRELTPVLLQPQLQSEAGVKFKEWYEKNGRNTFKGITEPINIMAPSLTDENKERINKLFKNFTHDSILVLSPINLALSGDNSEAHYLAQPATQWVENVFERTLRLMNNQAEIKTEGFSPAKELAYLNDLFEILAKKTPNLKIDFPLEKVMASMPNLIGDPLYFQGAVFNIVRNAQNIVGGNPDAHINIDFVIVDGKAVLTVSDNGPGFKPEHLAYHPVTDGKGNVLKDDKGNEISRQGAIIRGETQRPGGSGLGLDIVRELVEDQFKGSVLLSNTEESGKTGAIVTVTFPKIRQ